MNAPRSMPVIALALVSIVACAAKDQKTVGPELHATLDSGFSSVDESSTQDATLGTDADTYTIKIQLSTYAGSDSLSTSTLYPAKSVVVTTTVAGETIPDSPYDADTSNDNVTFTRHDPITLPASAKGKTLVFHAQAVDSRGLHSNTIDISATLD